MDPLTAFGLASNIIQLIDFARRLIKGTGEHYKDNSLRHLVELRKTLEIYEMLYIQAQLYLDETKKGGRRTAPRNGERGSQHRP